MPDAHVPGKTHAPMMATTDLALLHDPSYRAIAERFRDDHAAFSDAYARAWFKLLHRDMGPANRLLGPWVPEAQLWQDPIPAGTPVADVAAAKAALLSAGTVSELVATAWAAAATFRSISAAVTGLAQNSVAPASRAASTRRFSEWAVSMITGT